MLARVANKADALPEAIREHLHIMALPCGLEARFIDEEELAFEGVGIHRPSRPCILQLSWPCQILPHGASRPLMRWGPGRAFVLRERRVENRVPARGLSCLPPQRRECQGRHQGR